ncbi:tyrosine-type recombinase/integrase [Peterkaempfera sp. SMS 1(5)a]|uniref:tyrosine-type recombinase/integrase n=1 Tax=Peterkaempfera podocarpi TaxID=3232308 RepID=UPI00366CB7EB
MTGSGARERATRETAAHCSPRPVASSGLLPSRLHDLRHGAATLALAGGVDMKVVSEMLGHSSIKITSDIYVGVLPTSPRTPPRPPRTPRSSSPSSGRPKPRLTPRLLRSREGQAEGREEGEVQGQEDQRPTKINTSAHASLAQAIL